MGCLFYLKKVMTSFIPVNEPLLDGNEKKYLSQCVDSGWISSEGPFVSQFEENFSRRVGRKHGVACANGSAALDIAIAALKLGPGDEVIVPTLQLFLVFHRSSVLVLHQFL